MNKIRKNANDVIPGDIFHPGEHLKDELDARKMTQQELADRMRVSKSELSSLIHGRRNITPLTAVLLEKVLKIDAEFWMNLQMKYELDLVRKRTQKSIRSAKIPSSRKHRLVAGLSTQ